MLVEIGDGDEKSLFALFDEGIIPRLGGDAEKLVSSSSLGVFALRVFLRFGLLDQGMATSSMLFPPRRSRLGEVGAAIW